MSARTAVLVSMLEQLNAGERADVATAAIGWLDAGGFARVCATLFVRLGDIAKSNPREAGRLAAALYGHLSAYRPESPAPLDAGFAPTEVERDPRGHG